MKAGRLPQAVRDWLERVERERAELERAGIFVNYVKPVIFQGKKVWALGSDLFFSDNPNQTFHEFILQVLVDTLDRDWLEGQGALPYDRRHYIAKCLVQLEEWKRRNAATASVVRPGVFAVEPDGSTLYLLSLAFDIATLRSVSSLPAELVARLRHFDQFQGARYEIAVAAVFARIDCEIAFFGREAAPEKHPEFVAQFRPTDSRVAVEAKSRHRPGVLHQHGELDETQAMRGDVSGLLREALRQDPGDQAFMVFIDLNSPLTPGLDVLDKTWAEDLKNVLDQYEEPTIDRPDPMTLLFFTNFSYHYEEGVPASAGEYLSVRPLFVRHDVDPELLNRLHAGIGGYGRIPNVEPEPQNQ